MGQAKAGPSKAGRCTSNDVPLPVVDSGKTRANKVRKSKNARRRAIVLIAIQALMIAHVVQWLVMGRTVTPIEPSESMQTLEQGYVNLGLIFFALALLSTLLLGRWICGWGCHIVMLQDFCGWIMKKCGVTPRPFRSRILVWAPLVLALYMFVWPTFKRLALFPLLEGLSPSLLVYFKPVAAWGGYSNHLVTEDFWATFPIVMAVPTLLVVGFAAVYLLGSKGFCTYGCPYGGFFAPLDEFAPGRIRVDHDKCEHCGHCTAVCTSNVRVHEEIREYGMVVDPGCMKCMDCVSVCPNDALSFGFGKPATKKGPPKNKPPKKIYDLSLREDLMIAGLFVLAILSVRGLYLWEGVPLLMAMGVAGVLSFAIWKTSRLFRRKYELIRLQNLKLKWRGRITPAGWAFAAVTAGLALIAAQNGVVNWHRWRATIIEGTKIHVARQAAFSPFNVEAVPRSDREAARRAITHLESAMGLADGGAAIMTDPDIYPELAWFQIVEGDFAAAEASLHRFAEHAGIADELAADITRLKLLKGARQEAVQYAESILAEHPEFENLAELLNALRSAPGAPAGS